MRQIAHAGTILWAPFLDMGRAVSRFITKLIGNMHELPAEHIPMNATWSIRPLSSKLHVSPRAKAGCVTELPHIDRLMPPVTTAGKNARVKTAVLSRFRAIGDGSSGIGMKSFPSMVFSHRAKGAAKCEDWVGTRAGTSMIFGTFISPTRFILAVCAMFQKNTADSSVRVYRGIQRICQVSVINRLFGIRVYPGRGGISKSATKNIFSTHWHCVRGLTARGKGALSMVVHLKTMLSRAGHSMTANYIAPIVSAGVRAISGCAKKVTATKLLPAKISILRPNANNAMRADTADTHALPHIASGCRVVGKKCNSALTRIRQKLSSISVLNVGGGKALRHVTRSSMGLQSSVVLSIKWEGPTQIGNTLYIPQAYFEQNNSILVIDPTE